MTSILVIFGLLGIGMVLVIYGTIAKNRWGINLDPVSCPRCNTPFPQIRQPRNIRQALWGGGTCTKCGAEVDKWGREVTAPKQLYPSGIVETQGQMRSALKRKLIFYSAGGFFCLTLLFAWLGIRPSVGQMVWKAWPLWMRIIAAAIVETVIFTALFYSASIYLLGRFVFKGHRPSSS
jgi:hypothetical protein